MIFVFDPVWFLVDSFHEVVVLAEKLFHVCFNIKEVMVQQIIHHTDLNNLLFPLFALHVFAFFGDISRILLRIHVVF